MTIRMAKKRNEDSNAARSCRMNIEKCSSHGSEGCGPASKGASRNAPQMNPAHTGKYAPAFAPAEQRRISAPAPRKRGRKKRASLFADEMLFFYGFIVSLARTRARTVSGDVRQHPPMMRAPARFHSGASAPKSDGAPSHAPVSLFQVSPELG